jgi:hypothetical protein
MTDFLRCLDKALKGLGNSPGLETSIRLYEQEGAKERLLQESKKPQEGIYYWFPYEDNTWKLYSFWSEFYGSKTIHAVIWDIFLARELAEHWGKLSVLQDIKKYPYGLPRGRIVQSDGKLVVWHGGDSPVENWTDRVFDEFNLPRDTEVIEHSHEKPKQSHVDGLKALGIPI